MGSPFKAGKRENTSEGRSSLNRTLLLCDEEQQELRRELVKLDERVEPYQLDCRIINQDLLSIIQFLPDSFVDLLFLDPPYNLNKSWRSTSFKQSSVEEYAQWMDAWLGPLVRVLKSDASVYICGDWQTSASIYPVVQKYFTVRNRITWEREKGRGSRGNWKNCSEDIWFCTLSGDYHFDADAVKLRRRVIAPYVDRSGYPKDWEKSQEGNYRLTYPSNIWTDITVPFWSMPENTDHPTQKSEKMLAKIVLASSKPNALIFDPFLGVGTTAVVAKKLGRRYLGVEIDESYCCLAVKRLAIAEYNSGIQGYSDGVFWERNSAQGLLKRVGTEDFQSPLF